MPCSPSLCPPPPHPLCLPPPHPLTPSASHPHTPSASHPHTPSDLPLPHLLRLPAPSLPARGDLALGDSAGTPAFRALLSRERYHKLGSAELSPRHLSEASLGGKVCTGYTEACGSRTARALTRLQLHAPSLGCDFMA
ncbi:unnamed protein product [Arctogadus glacialis]